MERRLESELKDVKSQILAMAGFVEQAIERALEALEERNLTKLSEVHAIEKKINQAHIDVDTTCLGLLARQAPVAADLRLILAIIKINTDLERMGDQAVNLSHNTEHYLKHPTVSAAQNLPQMSALVRVMVRESLDAFVNSDLALARKVLMSDDAVDSFKDRTVQQLTELMKTDPGRVEACLNLILIARNLERLGDHATNIAEDVIFATTGEDVRHRGSQGGGPDSETKS